MSSLPRPVRVLRDGLLPDGRRVDLTLAEGRVVDVLPAGTAPAVSGEELELDGRLLLTAAAEPHAHLDKTGSWDAIRPPQGDLVSAIAAWREYAADMTVDDVVERARAQVLRMLAQGTTAVRSHVDVLLGDAPTRGAEALLAVRAELGELVDLQLVALPGPDVATASIEAALDLGIDHLGGAPHLGEDAIADLERLLAIAERRGLPVDLHTDEGLDAPVTLAHYARITEGWSQNRSAGHCVRLGTLPADERDAVIRATTASGIGIIANPITNLFLQGWEEPIATPRGVTAARQVIDAGGRFAAGADNVRDPFNPLGRSDALETAMLLVTAAHLTIEEAWHAVSDGAREVMGLPHAGAEPGALAEFLILPVDSLARAVAEAPAERTVIHRGRVVAVSTVQSEVASPSPAPVGSR